MLSRRAALGALAGVGAAATARRAAGAASPATTPGHSPEPARDVPNAAAAGRLKQSVCRWPYARTPLPEFCRRARELGLSAVDLLFPDEWAVAGDAGLTVSMGYASRRDRFIETGFNDPANHAMLLAELEAALPLAARAKVPNLIAMFGNRVPGVDDAAAIEHCVAGLSRIAPLAAESGVTVCVELLNSKVNHPGYVGDHTAFGVAVVQGVNSPRVKLLYDIYHMQIMEGDVIRTLRAHLDSIGHFHTGGVPDRHEINDSQELNYHAIARAIADAGFEGFVAHEFSPTRADPYVSLEEAVQICKV